MNRVRAIIFDVDGTLFDTASLIYDAYDNSADIYGYERPTRAQVAAMMGRPIPEIMDALFPGVDIPAMMATNTEFVTKNASTVLAYQGLAELLEELKARGIKLGVLTSGGKKIHNLLDHHNVADYFSSVVYADRVVKHKPDPEGFNLALLEMNAEAEHTVMVGDLPPDIQVGKAVSALATVGITHGFGTREMLEAEKADYVIDTLTDLIEVIEDLESK